MGVGGRGPRGDPRLGPVTLGADLGRGGRRRRREERAKRGDGLLVPAGLEAPPAEPQLALIEERVRAALDEPPELGRRAIGLADAPERIAPPERDVAVELARHALRPDRR